MRSASALLTVSSSAKAVITISHNVGFRLNPPVISNIDHWDVDKDGIDDFSLANFFTYQVAFAASGSPNRAVVKTSQPFNLVALPKSFVVGSVLNTGYIFKTLSSIERGAFTVNSAILSYADADGFALDTPIQTEAVPEPETTAMDLAALALGAARVHHCRKAKAA